MKFRLLLVDTNVLLELFRLGLWEAFLGTCDVHVSETIMDEARFYEDDNGDRRAIDLEPDRLAGRLTVHAVGASQLAALTESLGPTLLEKMDPGEAELLCVLDAEAAGQEYKVCSADAVIFRYLGATYRSDRGVSLEEVLSGIGRTVRLEHHYRQGFREKFSRIGFEQGITGQATR